MASDVDVDIEKDKRFRILAIRISLTLMLIDRIILIRDFTVRSLRIKPDKWIKLCNSDEIKYLLIEFVTRGI